jgi:cell wall-associated NlpC family hydrolase
LASTNRLLAIGLATVVALAGISTQPAPVAAADPIPTPAPTEPAPTEPAPTEPAPTTDPIPTPAPTQTAPVDPSLTSSPATVTASPPVIKPYLGARVVRIALAQRGKRYSRGSVGPRAFDCSGLVRYAYRRGGVSSRIGGGQSARSMLRWGRIHHLTSRSNPRVGDIVIYGNGTHAAIYIGHGRVISALNRRQGIRITGLHALRAPFTTFIHTHL